MSLENLEKTAEAEAQKAAAEVKTFTIANPWVALLIAVAVTTIVVALIIGAL